GQAPGYPTPRAMVADNDAALGHIVSDLSHGKDWARTVVFVAEDDAQGGQDHIDAHRSVFLAIGPTIRHHYVCHRPFSQPAIRRTIFALLGLPPMTAQDAAAPILDEFFSKETKLSPYEAIPPRISTTEPNPRSGPLARQGAAIDLSQPDRDDGEMAVLLAQSRETRLVSVRSLDGIE
ncbi:MAG: hypothetical protein KGR26_10800, partial [Cyanobacteria bacterium REEB65]|nr:hypothetical protein [Cyanobacteria bacterium REEB65]